MKTLTLALTAAALLAAGPTLANDLEALSKKNMCSNCHALDGKRMGPSFKEIAAKHKGAKDAEAVLTKAIVEGSKGVYGKIPMPPQPKAAPDAAAMAKAIIAL